jgi:hypothetical protein
MSMLVGLVFLLAIGWMAAKLLTGRARPQAEDLKTISLDQERPRALSYTEMMNSGKPRIDPISHGEDWHLS